MIEEEEELQEVLIPGEESWLGALSATILGLGVGLPIYKLYKFGRRAKVVRDIERKYGKETAKKFMVIVQAYALAKDRGDIQKAEEYASIINEMITLAKVKTN